MIINNKKDLEAAYLLMRYFENRLKTTKDTNLWNAFNYIIAKYKKDIRGYYNYRNSPFFTNQYVAISKGDDYYVEKIKLPFLGNYDKKEVEKLFRENYFIQCPNSPWDCTGKPFTSNFVVFKNSFGEWWAYHVISLDV